MSTVCAYAMVPILVCSHLQCLQVVTARDFSMLFDAYAQFEESLITAKMEMEEDSDDDSEEEGDDVELEMRLARLEHLMDRRPELFSSVK